MNPNRRFRFNDPNTAEELLQFADGFFCERLDWGFHRLFADHSFGFRGSTFGTFSHQKGRYGMEINLCWYGFPQNPKMVPHGEQRVIEV